MRSPSSTEDAVVENEEEERGLLKRKGKGDGLGAGNLR